jgi:hypothetical protein
MLMGYKMMRCGRLTVAAAAAAAKKLNQAMLFVIAK